jgi:hypothetical protein
MKENKSLDGIISYLDRVHGGDLLVKRIVTVTSKSIGYVRAFGTKHLADPNADTTFVSENEAGQWVCWDFRERRIRLTHYIIAAEHLPSWILEGSMDCDKWVVLHEQEASSAFKAGWQTASFAVPGGCCTRWPFVCIRLTQTDMNHEFRHSLAIGHVEFFGTLFQ